MSTLLLSLLITACGGDDGTGDTASGTTASTTGTTATTGYETAPDGSLAEPLSMPAEPTVSLENFNSAEECATCHPDHVAEWSVSNHAYAIHDPVYQALVYLRQADYDGLQDRYCTQCHSGIGVRSGDISPGFSFDDLAPITQEGVTCEYCHKVSEVQRTWNAGHVLDETGPLRSGIEDPVDNAYHASAFSTVQGSAEFCGGCHDVIEVSGMNLERPYEEWRESPGAQEGTTCIDCHMPTRQGPAATDGPERTLHDHSMPGIDVPFGDYLSPEDKEAKREAVRALLSTAATMTLDAAPVVEAGWYADLYVTVWNEIDSHALPTGSTFIRQLWVEVQAWDAMGNLLYETGTLDANGDLRDAWSELDPYGDDDLIKLSSGLVDIDGNPELFPWRAAEHWTGALSPLYDRTWTLFIPTAPDTVGPIHVEARLLFRSHPPFLLRLLGLDDYVDELEIHELASASIDIDVDQP